MSDDGDKWVYIANQVDAKIVDDEHYRPTRREMFVMAAMGSAQIKLEDVYEARALEDPHFYNKRAEFAIEFADAVMKRLDEEGK